MKRPSAPKKSNSNKKRQAVPVPAKITPPHLDDCYLRKGLFQKLDQCRDKPAVWISGPAGSGKTMLAASYLQERNISYLWYQIDARDEDPATLFYYLGLAAKHHAPRRRWILPLLTPEYLGGMPAFTRNFFEALFERLTPPFALVLDNYQELVEKALLHEVMRDLLAVVPDGGQVIIISRAQPPPAMGRFHVHQRMTLLTWQELQLSIDEVRALSGMVQKAPLTRSEAEVLHAATLGWAAGVVLMLVQPRADLKPIDADTLSAPEAVFDYFAAEILAKLDEATRDFLFKSAFLPQVSDAMATFLTGHKQAGRILAYLARKNYFTLQGRSRKPRMYQYHPLFKAFLQGQAHTVLAPEALQKLKLRTANLLIKNNQHDEAAALLGNIADWERLTQLIIHQAQTMVVQGRSSTLQAWINRIPVTFRMKAPWILYWQGICLMSVDLVACRSCLEDAFKIFKGHKDPAGLYLAWSGVVESYVYEYGDMAPLDQWIDEIEALLKSYPQFPSPQIEAQVTSAVFCALMYRRPDHSDMGHWEERIKKILLNTRDIHLQLGLGSHLILYYLWWVGGQNKAKYLVNILKQALSKADIAPLHQIIWRSISGTHLWMTNHLQECHDEFTAGLTIAEKEGIHVWDFMHLVGLAHTCICQGKIEEAEAYVKKMTFILGTQRKSDIAHYYYLNAYKELYSANYALALEHINRTGYFVREAGAPFSQFYFLTGKADILIELGEYEQAEHCIEATLQYGLKINSHYSEYQCAWLMAALKFKQKNDQAGYFHLRKYLSISKECGIVNHTYWRSSVMAPLLTKALAADIEVDHVQRLIREHDIEPPLSGHCVKNWPYPVKVYTFGAFSVLVDNKPLSDNHRGQNKPLALLKAIIAYGGQNVSERVLSDDLWPDAEGDAAHVAFTTTLHRLRKILGLNRAVTLNGHQVSLDRHCCWVDLYALNKLLSQADELAGTCKTGVDRQQQLTDQIFKLYQGRFLEGDDAAWLLTPRERLHNRVLQQLEKTAAHLEGCQQWQQAATSYEHGLAIDPLMEGFYQGFIRCLEKMGRRAEALVVYRRCCKVLKTSLNIPPSAKTQALGKQLQD